MAAEENDAQSGRASGGKSRLVPVIVVVMLMGVEGAVVFWLATMLAPEPVAIFGAGMEGAGGSLVAPGEDAFAEVEMADCRPSNKSSGRLITFKIRVLALVASADRERAEKLARSKRARLEDGVNTIIRSAEPKHLNEPELATIKRRLKHKFDEILDDEQLVKEVLIPEILPSGSGV